MTRIILPPLPGALSMRGFGLGFPGLHNQSRAAGNGFAPNVTKQIYYAKGITNNTAANSSTIMDWLRDEGAVFNWWDDVPFVFTFYNRLTRLNGNSSSCSPVMAGGLASWDAGLGFDQWLTDTTRKRIGILSTRDAGGTINHYLSWSNAVVRNQLNILALPNPSWVNLVVIPSPREVRIYVDANLWANTMASDLPTGLFTDNILYSLGAAKKLIDATETSVRVYAPMLAAVKDVT